MQTMSFETGVHDTGRSRIALVVPVIGVVVAGADETPRNAMEWLRRWHGRRFALRRRGPARSDGERDLAAAHVSVSVFFRFVGDCGAFEGDGFSFELFDAALLEGLGGALDFLGLPLELGDLAHFLGHRFSFVLFSLHLLYLELHRVSLHGFFQ